MRGRGGASTNGPQENWPARTRRICAALRIKHALCGCHRACCSIMGRETQIGLFNVKLAAHFVQSIAHFSAECLCRRRHASLVLRHMWRHVRSVGA